MNKETSNLSPDACFVVVKYGDDQEALLNPWCSAQTFVEWIKRICQCESDSTLDLVDLDGQIRNLPMTSEDYASDYVTARETYVAIRVERQGEQGPMKYTPLLNNLEMIHPDLLVKLDNLSRPSTRSSKRDKYSRKTPTRNTRGNSNKNDNKTRPPSSDRRSRQGK